MCSEYNTENIKLHIELNFNLFELQHFEYADTVIFRCIHKQRIMNLLQRSIIRLIFDIKNIYFFFTVYNIQSINQYRER